MEIGMVFPVLPGKSESLAEFARVLMEDRKDEYERSQTSVLRENWWIQPTHLGDVCVVHFEAEDPGAVFAALGSSEEPFDVWFRSQVLDNTGVDLSEPPNGLPRQIFRWSRS